MRQFVSLLSDAWGVVVRARRTLALWNLFSIAIAAILIAPLSSVILGLGFFRSGELVIGNLELVDFVLSPAGIVYVVLAGSLRLVVIAAGGGGTLAVVLDFLLNLFGFSLLVALTTRIWREHIGYTSEPAKIPIRGGLRAITSSSLRSIRYWTRPRRLAPALLVLLIVSVAGSGSIIATLPDPSTVVISAHRAGPPPAPENTLSALEAAIRDRADYSEIDLLRTSDGTIVIVHDEDLMRVAGDPRRIASTPFAELADVVQVPDDGNPESERRIATLEDFLRRADGRIRLMIEFKYYGFDPDLVPQAIQEIRAHGSEDEVLLMSLSLRAVQQAADLAPDIPRGYVTAAAIGDMTRLPVDFVAVAGGRITPALLRDAAAAGIAVHAWTINSPVAVVDLIDRGVDGIITDYPAMVVAIREQMAAMSPVERMLLRYGRLVSMESATETSGSGHTTD